MLRIVTRHRLVLAVKASDLITCAHPIAFTFFKASMKTSFRKNTLWICLALFPVAVHAQVQTLKDATQKAILTNPEVLARWNNYQAAGSERDVASGAYLPSINLGASAGRSQYENRLGSNDFSRSSANATLNQMLYDGFFTHNEVKRLDHARLVRLFELYDTSETTALEVVRAYSDVVRYRKLVALAEENYVTHRAVFEQIERKAKAGVARRVDLEQISGRVALAEANLLTETANLHDVSARYQRLVGNSPAAQLENPVGLVQDMPSDIVTALQAANKKHPSLQAAIENIRSVNSSLEARRAAYQPRLDFRVRAERGNNIDNISGRTTNNSAEFVVTWNIFNGGSDSARVSQYASLLSEAQNQRDKVCRDIRQTLAIAYNDTRKLKDLLSYLDQHQLSIEKARNAYRQQFDIGQRSLLDLLDTENELFQAKRSYANAEFDLILAYARTHAGMGTLYSALGISRQDPGSLPDFGVQNDGADVTENCGIEAPQLYVADIAALNARAADLVNLQAPAATIAPNVNNNLPAVIKPQADNGDKLMAARTALLTSLRDWRAAWESRNTEAYLGFYAKKYTGKAGWSAQRRSRLQEAKEIKLELNDIQLELQDATHATSHFTQDYRSAVYQDVLQKTLIWEFQNGRWVIVNERVDGPPNAKQW